MASVLDRVVGVAGKVLFRDAEVTGVDLLAERLRRITLAGPGLVGVRWTPGAKVQVRTDGLTFRTYTPCSWDPEVGTTELIAYHHGDHPGARWVRAAAVGDHVQLFGPRGSIDLGDLTGPVVLAGDETTFGLALALATVAGVDGTTLLFEVADEAAAATALGALELEADTLRAGDPTAVAAHVVAALEATPGASLVLAGDQATIKVVRAAVKTAGLRPTETKVKAYWAEGRTGLD